MAAKKNKYWLLLLVSFLAVSLILSPGSTLAHYHNAAQWNTVLFPESAPVASNCLVPDGRQTVLLGELPESGKPYDFTLEGTPGTAAPIYFGVNEEARPYLDVELRLGDTQLSGSQTLTIPESGKLVLTLFLKPVTTRAHGILTANIKVRWGGDPVTGNHTEADPLLLAGTFQTVVGASQAAVTATLGDAPLTAEGAAMDLGDLPREGVSLDLTLTSDKEVAQALSWTLDEAAAEFVNVTVTRNGLPVRSGSDIKMEYDALAGAAVPVVLTVNVVPVNRVRQAMPVALTLAWGDLTGLISANLPEAAVTSDLLTPTGETVLLETLPQEGRSMTFTLSALADTTAQLTWSSPYLNVTMTLGETALTSGDEVTVPAGQTVEITVTLTPGEESREATSADLRLNWGDLLSAVFAVPLEAVEEVPPIITDPTEPEVTEPEVTEPEVTEPEVTEPEVTEPEVTEPEVTEPETTEPAVVPMTNTDPNNPVENPEIPVTDPETPSEPTEPEPTEPVPTEPVLQPVTVSMETLENFTAKGLIPVELTLSSNTEHVILSQAASSDAASPMGLLPPFTRYTLDGENYFLLYNGGSIYLTREDLPPEVNAETPPATVTVRLFLDISATNLSSKLDLILMVQTVGNGTERAEDRSVLRLAMGDDLTQAMILNPNEPLTLNLPEGWKILKLEHPVIGITVEERDDRAPTLVSYPVKKEQIQVARVTMESQPHVLTVRIGTELPPAGTYVLTLKWYYQEVCIEETQITFYVNYSLNAVPEETGGTEP